MTEFTDNQKLPASDLNNNLPPIGCFLPYGGSSAPNAEWLLCDGSAISRATYATLFGRLGTAYGAGDGSTTFNLPDGRGRMFIGAGATTFTLNFAAADVDTGAETIAVPSNTSLYDGVKVRLTTTGTLPAGLSLATDYYVIRVSATSIKLAASRANAIGAGGTGSAGTVTPINLTSQGTGTHTITVQDLSTRTVGEKGGEEKRSLSIAELPSHAHTGGVSGADSNDASLNSNTIDVPTGATGGDTPHNIMNPYFTGNWIVKAK